MEENLHMVVNTAGRGTLDKMYSWAVGAETGLMVKEG
jgi:hypothetical protein